MAHHIRTQSVEIQAAAIIAATTAICREKQKASPAEIAIWTREILAEIEKGNEEIMAAAGLLPHKPATQAAPK